MIKELIFVKKKRQTRNQKSHKKRILFEMHLLAYYAVPDQSLTKEGPHPRCGVWKDGLRKGEGFVTEYVCNALGSTS